MTDGAADIASTTPRSGSTSTGPIRSVSVVSTGTVQIHPQQANGSQIPLYVWLVGSRRWTPPRPISAYVLEQDRASVTDPATSRGSVTGFLYGRLARFQIERQDTLLATLAALGHAYATSTPFSPTVWASLCLTPEGQWVALILAAIAIWLIGLVVGWPSPLWPELTLLTMFLSAQPVLALRWRETPVAAVLSWTVRCICWAVRVYAGCSRISSGALG